MSAIRRICSLATVSLLSVALSGCAMVLAQRNAPDASKVSINAPRAIVEKELGTPISDMKVGMGRSGERRCVYKVLVKVEQGADSSTVDTVVDGFTGFKTYEYTVIYDRDSRVMHLKQVVL